MALFDVTRELGDGLALYPGDPPLQRFCYRRLPDDPYEAALLSLGSHAGTHLDAPRHFFESGRSVDALPLDWLCGRARVLDLRAHGASIDSRALAGHDLLGVERLLLRTVAGAGQRAGSVEREAHLTPDAARHLVAQGRLRLVGIDSLSIEAPNDPVFTTHRLLLGAEPPVLVLEGLDLEGVPPGDYELWCLPLRWRGAEAAPVRAVLRELGGD